MEENKPYLKCNIIPSPKMLNSEENERIKMEKRLLEKINEAEDAVKNGGWLEIDDLKALVEHNWMINY